MGRRSYVVLDPKGEICATTSRDHRAGRSRTVIVINPYRLFVERPDMKSDTWNPLGDAKNIATKEFERDK